jgi:hypothetical protein
MTLNDWIMVAICAIVSLVVLIGCFVDLHHLKKAKKEDL